MLDLTLPLDWLEEPQLSALFGLDLGAGMVLYGWLAPARETFAGL